MSHAKLMICSSRKPGTARKSFHTAFEAEVGAKTVALQKTLGFVRYEQLQCMSSSHPLHLLTAVTRSRLATSLLEMATMRTPHRYPEADPTCDRVPAETWDVIDEMWWPSVEELLKASTSEGGLAALGRLRELREPSTQEMAAVVCRELVMDTPRAERPNTSRLTFCLRPRAQDTPEEMQSYWENDHATLVRSLAADLGFDQYDQAHAVLNDERVQPILEAVGGRQSDPYVGFASLSFPTTTAIAMQLARPKTQIANFKLMRDELSFIDPPSSSIVIGTRVAVGSVTP